MEEQKIITITAPRINLKRNFLGQLGWELSFSSEDGIEEIIKEIRNAHKMMLEKFEEEIKSGGKK